MSRHKLAHNTLLCLLGWYENLSFPCTGSSSSTMFEIFLSRIYQFSLFRETSQVYVNNMHKINFLYTILLLFFNFFPFHSKVWQVNHFGDLSVKLIHFCFSMDVFRNLCVEIFPPYTSEFNERFFTIVLIRQNNCVILCVSRWDAVFFIRYQFLYSDIN